MLTALSVPPEGNTAFQLFTKVEEKVGIRTKQYCRDNIYKLSNEIDALEQYSRRNCLIVHGVPDTADPVTAVLDIFNNKLGVPNRPIIVKLTSYQVQQNVFSGKWRLKGTKLLITENLTRCRSELLNKAKTLNNVTATWMSDGRIVCLLSSGRKVSITTVQDLRQLDQQ